MNSFSEDQIKMLKNMGALGYPPVKIASIMGLELKDVEKEFEDQKSLLYKTYIAGADYASYIIDLKLFEMAQSGDIKAIDKLEMRKKLMKRGS